jgi:hypothetical protein
MEKPDPIFGSNSTIFSSASAAESSPAGESPSEEVAITAIEQLKSDDTIIRRSAREDLANVALNVMPLIMQELRKNYKDYRVRLGICVALAQSIRDDKFKADSITKQFTDADLDLLLDAAGDPDRTVRVYATEFLLDLGSPRSAMLAIRRASNTDNAVARYNWIFSAQEGWRKLPTSTKKELVVALEIAARQSGEQTRALINKFKSS